jgi:hypothetical protein
MDVLVGHAVRLAYLGLFPERGSMIATKEKQGEAFMTDLPTDVPISLPKPCTT